MRGRASCASSLVEESSLPGLFLGKKFLESDSNQAKSSPKKL